MQSPKHFRLLTLGRLALVSVDGDTEQVVVARVRHLAVLAVLALSRRPLRRDALVEMFWGGDSEERARHSLSNALSALRSILGPDAISGRQSEIVLLPQARLAVDAVEFSAAVDTHDVLRAARLYRGPLLEGVFVDDAPEFDAWLARERGRIERQFLTLCEAEAPGLLRRGAWEACASLAEQWLHAAPSSVTAFTTLLRARSGPDTPVALQTAMREYERLRAWLEESHGLRPDAAVSQLAREVRDRLAMLDVQAAQIVATAPPVVAMLEPSEPPLVLSEQPEHTGHTEHAVSPKRLSGRFVLRRRTAFLALPAALAVLAAAFLLGRRAPLASDSPGTSSRPVIAVADIDNVRGDTAIAWLRMALPQMIAVDLASTSGVEVVAPSRVRDAIIRLAGRSDARLADDQAVDVARRLGANFVVTGGLTSGNGLYVLDVTISDVASGKQVESYHVFATNPLELGRLASVHLADAANARASTGGPRFADIETTSPEAYRHYIRALQANEAGRYPEDSRELDAAIALDSGFVSAMRLRASLADLHGETGVLRQLVNAIAAHPDRISELDRLNDEIQTADSTGEFTRAEVLARALVERYPHDPRAYNVQAAVLTSHGRWGEAAKVLEQELALDSLALDAGDGPCAPCEVFSQLADARLCLGDRAGAERAARRWVTLQSGLPRPWATLMATLARSGQYDEAIDAGRHLLAMSNDPRSGLEFVRSLLMARRYAEADSILAIWRAHPDPAYSSVRIDLTAMLQRERGQFTASVATLNELPPHDALELVRADGLARTGHLAEALTLFDRSGHDPHGRSLLLPPQARGFSWGHALEADALLRAGDSAAARPFIDSVRTISRHSYYGRDWLLPHHLDGQLAWLRKDYATAEREFRAARFLVGGWSLNDLDLARAQLVLGHTSDAIVTLRQAYIAPLDGMGRYVPRSEIDFWMSRAFTAARQPDSAATYAAYVRAAWANADPQVRALLPQLTGPWR